MLRCYITHLVVWGTDNTCFAPMNSPRCRNNPPDWSEQEVACCCTKARGDREINNIKYHDKCDINNISVRLNSQLVWVSSPGSSAPSVCAVQELCAESPSCEEAWRLIGREAE